MVRSRELGWFVATAGLVTATLFAVPVWSTLHAEGQREQGIGINDDADRSRSTCADAGSNDSSSDALTAAGATRPGPAGERAQSVLVRLPRTAMIRIDHTGNVVAAWTNTGCAPRTTDEVWLMGPDGSITAAGSTAIVDRSWQGDFSQSGVFVLQRDPVDEQVPLLA